MRGSLLVLLPGLRGEETNNSRWRQEIQRARPETLSSPLPALLAHVLGLPMPPDNRIESVATETAGVSLQ